jgi:hypothetical protein
MQWAVRDIELAAKSEGALPVLADLVNQWPRFRELDKLWEQAKKRYESALKNALAESGPQPCAGGTLTLEPVPRESVDVPAAWPAIIAEIGIDGVRAIAKMSKGAIADAIRERTPKNKAKAVNAFFDQLRATGAITTTVSEQVRWDKEERNGRE